MLLLLFHWKKRNTINKANLRDLIAATVLVFLLKIGFKSLIFGTVRPGNLMEDLEKQQGTSSILWQSLCVISKPSVNSKWSYSPETLNLGQNWHFFCPVYGVTLKFDLWPTKTIAHLFYATSSFVHHFITICDFKWSYSQETPNLGQNRWFFVLCDLEI